MAEPTDAILPILKRIQTDLTDVKRVQAAHTEKLDEIEGFLTYSLGIQQRHVVDIASMKEQISEIKRRLAALEKRK